MDSLKAAAQAMFGQGAGAPKEEKTGESNEAPSPSDLLGSISPEMLKQISTIMSMMNKKDHRSELLEALKPHLSERRRKRADEAMQMMKLLDIMPLLQSRMTDQSGR